MTLWQKFWQFFIEPPAAYYPLSEERRLARMLAVMLFSIGLMGVIITALLGMVVDASTPFYEDSEFWIVFIGASSLLIPYQLNRRGQYRTAARLFIYITLIAIYLTCIPGDLMSDLNMLVFLVVPILISSLFVPFRSTVRLIVFEVVLVLALTTLPEVALRDVTWQLSFLLMTSMLIIVATYYQLQVEQARRQALEESEQRYRTMFDSTVQGVIVHDGQSIIMANEVAARVAGYRQPDDLIGKPLSGFLHPDETARIQAFAQARFDQATPPPPERYEMRVLTPNGLVRWIDSRSTPVMLDGRQVTMVNGVDVTDLKQTETLLRRQNTYLASLHETALDLMNRRTVRELLQAILARAAQLCHTEHGYIYLLSPDGSKMISEVAQGVFAGYTNGFIYPGEGLTGKVWNTGKPLIIEDYDEWAGRLVDFDRNIFHAAVGVPMLSAGKVVGVIALVHCEPNRHFSAELIEGLEHFADLATIALDNTRLYLVVEGRNRMLEALNSVSSAIASSLDVDQVLNTVVRLTAQVLDGTSAYICNWNREQGTTTVLVEYISPLASPREKISDVGHTYSLLKSDGEYPEWLLDPVHYLIAHVDDETVSGSEKRTHMREFEARSLLAVPMVIEGQAFAYIEVWESRRRREFSPEEVELLQSVANQASLAINRSRLYAALRQSESRNTAIIKASPDLIFRMDAQGVYLDVLGGNAEELYAPVEMIIGRNVRDILPSPIPEVLLKTNEWVLATGQMHTFEYQLEVPLGLQHYEARIVKSGDSEVFIFVRNITQRIQSQSQALLLSVERARVRLLEDFISDASHDLKTPLTNIKSRMYLLKKAKDEESRHRQIDVLEAEVTRLERLITDLLMMAQLDNQQHKFNHEPLDLNYLVNEAVKANQALVTQRGLTLHFEPASKLPKISGDPTQLSRVLENILSNALNYTPTGGTITARTLQDNSLSVVEISDTGMGISEEDLPHIFERFYRADKARSSDKGGTGLGLAIAKKIMELHGGAIHVTSTVGEGTTFRLALPIKKHE